MARRVSGAREARPEKRDHVARIDPSPSTIKSCDAAGPSKFGLFQGFEPEEHPPALSAIERVPPIASPSGFLRARFTHRDNASGRRLHSCALVRSQMGMPEREPM